MEPDRPQRFFYSVNNDDARRSGRTEAALSRKASTNMTQSKRALLTGALTASVLAGGLFLAPKPAAAESFGSQLLKGLAGQYLGNQLGLGGGYGGGGGLGGLLGGF